MKKIRSVLCCLLLSAGSLFAADVSPYQVVWTTPSKDVNGTMPLGNGTVGLNVWIDENGVLCFYISRIDSIDENGQILKIGAVRISPDKREPVSNFKQILDTKRGVLEAQYQTASGNDISLRLWADANRPMIVAEVVTKTPAAVTAVYENLHPERKKNANLTVSDLYKDCPYESPNFRNKFKTPEYDNLELIVEADTVVNLPNAVCVYHRNVHSKPFRLTGKITGMDEFKRDDPILHRTFGAVMCGEKAKKTDALTLQSEGTSHRFEIAVNMKHPAAAEDWLNETQNILDAAQKIPLDERKAQHEQWWREFWNRSWIHLTAEDSNAADAFLLTQCYTLQRYVWACAGRGALPIKFNGSIFTVPEKGNPDFRRWGSGYWFQNTRLAYHPMPAAGDFEMMLPFVNTYSDMLPLCRYRTQKYMGHGGAYYPECIYFWGDNFLESYGYEMGNERTENKWDKNPYTKYYWNGSLELALMILEYCQYSGDEQTLQKRGVPLALEVLKFFDEHYPVNEDGKMFLHPSQSLETWQAASNPMPQIVGQYGVIERLEQVAGTILTEKNKVFLEKLKQKLPPLPLRKSPAGNTMLAAAEKFDKKSNFERPELYAVFPYRQFAYNRPNVDWAIEAWRNCYDPKTDSGAYGWRQDDIFAAYLGLADEAVEHLLRRAKIADKNWRMQRFPVFWGPGWDWVPDQDHASILCKGVQSLVMQCDGKQIDIFPAFPKGWNCDFKLHAPYQTVVEGRLENGKITALKVTPKEREKDVQIVY
ncbi:MAG: DUF5703 domain-containing protein [Planctomycetaceae bacterium]|nr:DUF5703 domain-containing protein [Planctomycetaceae bacterium]